MFPGGQNCLWLRTILNTLSFTWIKIIYYREEIKGLNTEQKQLNREKEMVRFTNSEMLANYIFSSNA